MDARHASSKIGRLCSAALLVSVAASAYGQTTYTAIDLGFWPTGINNSGQVVGELYTSSGAAHAFLYSGGTKTDLNNLVSLPSGVYLTTVAAINDLGQIAPDGSKGLAYLLTPENSLLTVLETKMEIPVERLRWQRAEAHSPMQGNRPSWFVLCTGGKQ
jgi:probable HAF family extracellular repeat protein